MSDFEDTKALFERMGLVPEAITVEQLAHQLPWAVEEGAARALLLKDHQTRYESSHGFQTWFLYNNEGKFLSAYSEYE